MKKLLIVLFLIFTINVKGQEVLTYNDLVYLINHQSFENENYLNSKGWAFHKNLGSINQSESKKWKKTERHSYAYNRNIKTGDVHGFVQMDNFLSKSGQATFNKVYYTMQQLSVYNDFKSEILEKGFTFFKRESTADESGSYFYYKKGDLIISFLSFLDSKTSLNLYEITIDSRNFHQ